MSEGQALQKLARRIEKLVPQCPSGENSDKAKRETLYYAVRMMEWAQSSFSGSAGMRYKNPYKVFLDELTAAEQQHRIKNSLQGKPKHRRRLGETQITGVGVGVSKIGSSADAVIW